MEQIFFPSVLHPDKWGYACTNDSMTFLDACWRSVGCLGGAFGYFETLGDGTTQHTPLMPARAEHFTDYCASLVSHCLKNPDARLSTHLFGLDSAHPDIIRFLALIQSRDKRQWFTLDGCKVSTSTSKQYDKRWHLVPADCNQTKASALNLFWANNPNRAWFTLERYALIFQFENTLYSSHIDGPRWDKLTEFRDKLSDDHRAAFSGLSNLVRGMESIDAARRSLECTLHNFNITKENDNASATVAA